MKKHIHTVHEGHKDHNCEYCGKSFSQARNLKNHIHTIHEGHKDNKCESCDKSFSKAGSLKRHIRIFHEKNKENKCNSCDKSFTSKMELTKHNDIIPFESHKRYTCDSCGMLFKKVDSFKDHIFNEHVLDIQRKKNVTQEAKN